MKSIKEAFNYSFEQVSFGKEPEFTIHGIGYEGKWGRDTMATFIKDLESNADLQTHKQQEDEIYRLRQKVGELDSQNLGLQTAISNLTKANENLSIDVAELKEELEVRRSR